MLFCRSIDMSEEKNNVEVEEITAGSNEEGKKQTFKPQKRYFRQRAHCNPLSYNDIFE